MPKTLQTVQAKVAYITAEKSGEYGAYKSVLFVDVSAPDRDAPDHLKYWISYKPEQYAEIPAKGTVKTLVPNASGKGYSILGEAESTSPQQHSAATKPRASKEDILSYSGAQARLYEACYKQVSETMVEHRDMTTEDIRSIATTIFINTVRKFDL